MIPECEALPAALCLDREVSREEFLARIVLDGAASWQWRALGRCRSCGQVWVVEAPDTRTGALAFKVPDAVTWSDDDERAARISHVRRRRGGEAPTGECIVAGCPRRPLVGIAFCAEHDFEYHGTQC